MAKIELAHGGGGQKTQELISRLFHRYLDDPEIRKLNDGAVIGDQVFSTDSYVVNPLFFPGGDIGKLAVCGTANDLAVMGAEPQFLSLGFIIEEGFDVADLGRILCSIRATARRIGVRIVTGDTKVVEKGKADGLFINSSGIGRVRFPGGRLGMDRVTEGDHVIVSGPLGCHGVAVWLARSERSEFRLQSRVTSDVAPLWPLIRLLLDFPITFMRDPTRGGLAQTLNEMVSGSRDFGVEIDERRIPVSAAVRTVCDILGFDPLVLANEGRVVVVVADAGAEAVLQTMRRHPLGRQARLIGRIVRGHPGGRVVLRTALGTERIIMPPAGELLPRIC